MITVDRRSGDGRGGDAPWGAIGGVVAVLAVLAAAVVTSAWWQLLLGLPVVLAVPACYFVIRRELTVGWQRGLGASTAVLTLMAVVLTVDAARTLLDPPPPPAVTATCEAAASTSEALSVFWAPYGTFPGRAPRYDGEQWSGVMAAVGRLTDAARAVDDPNVRGSIRDVRENWSGLTGTQVAPIPEPLFTQGYLALAEVVRWCERRGAAVDQPPRRPGTDTTTLVKTCHDTGLLFEAVSAAVVDGVVSEAEVNDLQFAAGFVNVSAASEPHLYEHPVLTEASEVAGTDTGEAVARVTLALYTWLDGSPLPGSITDDAAAIEAGCRDTGVSIPVTPWSSVATAPVAER
ncbi:hypothetical protein [Geodermatophilus chilensis]|uniref:hypothetical protein n=1 Tax=Geodermatophilus chilensis TaxID=2035835 RepID=UPI0012FFD3C3|nr:hypothetical protein [Geodermatophilus chilensis]